MMNKDLMRIVDEKIPRNWILTKKVLRLSFFRWIFHSFWFKRHTEKWCDVITYSNSKNLYKFSKWMSFNCKSEINKWLNSSCNFQPSEDNKACSGTQNLTQRKKIDNFVERVIGWTIYFMAIFSRTNHIKLSSKLKSIAVYFYHRP